MLALSDYCIAKQLYESINSLIYRAYRLSDQQPVILKLLNDASPSPERRVGFQREYEVTHNLDVIGVVDAYALLSDQERLVMVLEDFGGDSLDRLQVAGQLEVLEFLNLAIATTEILASIHAANIIHQDINPSHIVLNSTTGVVKLIDFGSSTVLSATTPTCHHPDRLDDTLAYSSPEQTGRINRGIDYRTDFYSLGVTFYELLTGRLPVKSDDALDLIHASVARNPVPPAGKGEIPQAIADIVLKLMAKHPEDRYQSGYGLKADLEQCLQQLQTIGHINAFPLGRQDILTQSADYYRRLEAEVAEQTAELVSLKAELEQEIARRQQAEEQIRHSEAKLHAIVTNTSDGMMILDRQGKVKFANPAAAQLLDIPLDELIDYQWGIPLGETTEVELISSSGEVRIAEMRATSTQWLSKSAYVVALRDISDRKRTEQTLRTTEERFREIARTVSQFFFVRSVSSGQFLYASPAYERMWGRTCESLYQNPQSWIEAVHLDDRQLVLNSLTEQFQGNSVRREYRIVQPNGSIRWIVADIKLVRDETGQPLRFVGVAEDITERKQVEDALRHSEATNRAMISAIPDLLIRMRQDGTYLAIFRSEEFKLFKPELSVVGSNMYSVLPQELARERMNYVQQALDTGELQVYEHQLLIDDGIHYEETRIAVVGDDEVLLMVRDITDRKTSELALQQQTEILQTIFDNIPIMLCFYNADVEMQLINSAFEYTLGWSLAELQAIDFMAQCYRDPNYRASVLEFMMRADGTWQDFQLRTRSGNILYTSWANVRLPNGCTVGIGQDITLRKRAEDALRESVERERAIATIIQRMRQTLDIETIFTATTSELRQVLNCDRVVVYQFQPDWSGEFVAESVGSEWMSVMPEQRRNRHLTPHCLDDPSCQVKTLRGYPELVPDSHMQATQGGIYSQGVSYCVAQDIYQSGFTPCYINLLEQFQARAYITVPIVCGGQLWGLLASYQNSAARAWSEAEINTVVQIGTQLGVALQQAQLLQQTQQQSLQLQQAAYAAEVANRAKSLFLANMSHELRTPLNGILGYAQILQNDKNCTPQQQKGINIIHQCGEHLLTLINDVLDLSKIEAEKVELSSDVINLHAFLQGVSELFQIKAQQKKISFTFLALTPLPKTIYADEKRLRQVLLNLLSNAVKFTDIGGVIFKVEVVHSSKSSAMSNERLTLNTIRFHIADTGIGMTAEQSEKIFLPFEQVGHRSRRSEGTGLGLTITQKILALMGTQIFVESTPGVGSRFWFDLDVSVSSQLRESIPVTSTDNIIGYHGERRKILIVDDRWNNRAVILNMLESIGFDVVEASDGRDGLEKAIEWKPDLIITDLMMPVMDGFEMTQALRRLPEFQDTVVIAISASVLESERKRSVACGCQDFLSKPIQAEKLLKKLKNYLDLTWIYDGDNPSPTQETIEVHTSNTQTVLTAMMIPPIEELVPLYEAAHIAYVTGVKQIATRLQQLSPEYKTFASQVLDLAANFDCEEIVKLVARYLAND